MKIQNKTIDNILKKNILTEACNQFLSISNQRRRIASHTIKKLILYFNLLKSIIICTFFLFNVQTYCLTCQQQSLGRHAHKIMRHEFSKLLIARDHCVIIQIFQYFLLYELEKEPQIKNEIRIKNLLKSLKI